MPAITHTTSGEAFLGTRSLGRAHLGLCDVVGGGERKARGAIAFRKIVEEILVGRTLTILPESGYRRFDIIVTGVDYGCIAIASCGQMPWWE